MKLSGYIILISVLAFTSCTKEWEAHYDDVEKTVNARLWDSLKTKKKYSQYVSYLEQFKLDTFIRSTHSKTLFIPDNEAFSQYMEGDTVGFKETLKYHMTSTLFMLRNVKNKHKLPTMNEKYALIENFNNLYQFDGIEILQSSPLFMDGKYYEIDQVVEPKPNIYQYMKRNTPAFQRYVDTQDSLVLDKEQSDPVGFDDQGRTVYDSVTTVYNLFEAEYFAISQEYRDLSATLILPDQATYENALDDMAREISGNYQTHEDIPDEWQNEVLIPRLLHKGTYGGLLDPIDFRKEKIANINGDTIVKDFEIDPYSRVICSNGLVYDYASFSVGDTLYKQKVLEAESLVDSIGLGRFAWNEDLVTIEGNLSFQPEEQEVSGYASSDSTVEVTFENDFQGVYSVTFTLDHVFPAEYRLVWRTNYRTTGRYAIYVNGERIELGLSGYDEYDTSNLTGGFFSVLGYRLYPDERGFCSVDGLVNNIDEYGPVTVRLEYLGPGQASDNGLHVDYIALMPK